MTSIDQMVYSQPGIIPQFTGALTHAIFWAATVFLDHYSDYTHIVRGTSSEEALQAKEAYGRLSDTHRARDCTCRADGRRF